MLETLGEDRPLVDIGEPAVFAVESEFAGGFSGILADQQEIFSECVTRIVHAGIGPERVEGIRQECERSSVLRRHGDSARSHDRDRPCRDFDLPHVVVAEMVLNFEFISAERRNHEGLGDAGGFFLARRERDTAVFEFLDRYFGVVRRIGSRFDFRGMPETVPAVIDPLFRTACSGKVFIDIENIVLVFPTKPPMTRGPTSVVTISLKSPLLSSTQFSSPGMSLFHVLTSVV